MRVPAPGRGMQPGAVVSTARNKKATNMKSKQNLSVAMLGALLVAACPALASVHEVPLMRAAGGFQQGFVRVEAFDAGGEVRIEAWDDSGHRAETILTIRAGSVQGFNSDDLELGNASKGLATGIGMPMSGDWRLRLSAGFGFDANAYVRTQDGFVTSLDSTLKAGRVQVSEISFFNPASNQRQRSWLRIINDNDGEGETARITIRGVDDAGKRGQSAFSVSVPPLNAVSVDARDLEAVFGDGSGKWRLDVSSSRPVRIVNLLETPTGHLTSLEPAAGKEGCRMSGPWDRLPIGVGMGGSYQGVDRSGEDLRNSKWSGSDLGGASFENSNLGSSDLWFASLRFANLSGADLYSAEFYRTDLTGADLSDSKYGSFAYANLTGANLTRHSGGTFYGADLCGAVLDQKEGGTFDGANLSGASAALGKFGRFDSFDAANMSSMYLVETSFEGASLRFARLDGSDLTEAQLEGARFQQATLVGVRLLEASGERASFTSADLSQAIARDSDFESATFSSALLYRTDFRGASLSEATFDEATLVRANLTDADLLGAYLRKADLSRANFTDASLRGADLREAKLVGTNFTDADLREANLTDLDFCDARIQGVRLDDAEVSGTKCLPE